jgi:serine acetyltransferase
MAASIDHENVIGDYAHVFLMLRKSSCGEGTYWCGAVVLPNLKLANGVRLAGAVVICDIPDFTAVGNPARILVKTVKV